MKTATKTAPKPARKPSERRRALRRQPAIGTVCQFSSGSAVGGIGLVWNISTSGVSVLSNRSCAAGVRLSGELRSLDSLAKLPVAFDVTHVKELDTGDYVIAGPFSAALSLAKLKPFVSGAARAKATTRGKK